MKNENTTTLSSRRLLAGVPAVAAVGVPSVATALGGLAVDGDDPIFAAIEAHKRAIEESNQAYTDIDEAEADAGEQHGNRPSELIIWRNYHICGSEIDRCRRMFLRQKEMQWSDFSLLSPEEIEQEYRDAKARYQAAQQAAHEWDERAGIAHLRTRNDDLREAFFETGCQLAETKPTTTAGAAALVAYACDDMERGEMGWHAPALKSVAEALAVMSGI
jgi:hypothetical protein